VDKVYDSYMDSFHGKAMKLSPENSAIQELNTATCVNCHGSHAVKAVDDPTAPVAGMANLLKTCQKCHLEARPDFVAGFMGHKEASPGFLPEVYWGGRSFYTFSRAMLAGGVLVVAASIGYRGVPWVFRRVRKKKKDR
jgi:hypothetical protein